MLQHNNARRTAADRVMLKHNLPPLIPTLTADPWPSEPCPSYSIFATRPFGALCCGGRSSAARFGSFLNVVVYRVPLGLNLLRPPSHCPGCKRRIRSRDNVPVLSWLILRGRCRYCHTPISLRYPIVEAITALMFAALAAGEYASAGKNLPLQTDWANQGVPVIWSTKQMAWPLLLLFIYHLLLLSTLWCAGLMEIDGHRLPAPLYLPVLLAGLATATIAVFTHSGSLWWIWRHALVGDGLMELPDTAPLMLAMMALGAGGILWGCQLMRRRARLAAPEGTVGCGASCAWNYAWAGRSDRWFSRPPPCWIWRVCRCSTAGKT